MGHQDCGVTFTHGTSPSGLICDHLHKAISKNAFNMVQIYPMPQIKMHFIRVRITFGV
jgi:hypothetical protein